MGVIIRIVIVMISVWGYIYLSNQVYIEQTTTSKNERRTNTHPRIP